MKKVFVLLSVSLILFASCKKSTHDIRPEATAPTQTPVATETLNARFTYTTSDPVSIFEQQAIKFNNLSTGSVSCVWEFGNSTKTQEKEPTMSYPMHGYYTVKLTVFDGKGNKQTTTQDISILCLFYSGIHPDGTGG